MTKTSTTQFNMMVTFMEQHGDLAKPSGKSKGKAHTYRNWENLMNLLNSDASGPNKTDDQWKKVWRDLKSNTKKKGARIVRGGGETGGGPALNSKLTDLEHRVLQIIGPEATTGIKTVQEAGLTQAVDDHTKSPLSASRPEGKYTQCGAEEPADCVQAPPAPTDVIEIRINEESEAISTPTPHIQQTPEEVSTAVSMDNVDIAYNTMAQWNEAGPSQQDHIPPPDILPAHPSGPASVGQTTPRRQRLVRGRVRRSPWRRARPMSALERVQQAFLQSDEEWRNFFRLKEQKEEERERERMQLRAAELRVQEVWQEIVARALNILETHFK